MSSWLLNHQAVLFDCDGVLYRGSEPVPGAVELISNLKQLGVLPYFVTNNSTKSRRGLLAHLEKLGFSNITTSSVVSSAWATARFLKSACSAESGHRLTSRRLFVIGEQGLLDELTEAGFECITENRTMSREELTHTDIPSDIGAVVVGVDQSLSFTKATIASLLLRSDPHCLFVATNRDSSFPTSTGRCLPGAGPCVSIVAVASEREPIVIGKPETLMAQAVANENGLDLSRCVMVGDRFDTGEWWTHSLSLKNIKSSHLSFYHPTLLLLLPIQHTQTSPLADVAVCRPFLFTPECIASMMNPNFNRMSQD